MPAEACVAASDTHSRGAVGGTFASKLDGTLERAPCRLIVMQCDLSLTEQAVADTVGNAGASMSAGARTSLAAENLRSRMSATPRASGDTTIIFGGLCREEIAICLPAAKVPHETLDYTCRARLWFWPAWTVAPPSCVASGHARCSRQ